MKIFDLILVYVRWRVHHKVDARTVLREGNNVANILSVLENHEDTIDTKCTTSVWRGAKFEG